MSYDVLKVYIGSGSISCGLLFTSLPALRMHIAFSEFFAKSVSTFTNLGAASYIVGEVAVSFEFTRTEYTVVSFDQIELLRIELSLLEAFDPPVLDRSRDNEHLQSSVCADGQEKGRQYGV